MPGRSPHDRIKRKNPYAAMLQCQDVVRVGRNCGSRRRAATKAYGTVDNYYVVWYIDVDIEGEGCSRM